MALHGGSLEQESTFFSFPLPMRRWVGVLHCCCTQCPLSYLLWLLPSQIFMFLPVAFQRVLGGCFAL